MLVGLGLCNNEQLLPSAGQGTDSQSSNFYAAAEILRINLVPILGVVNALQDAVILANCFYDLESYDTKSITKAFKDYHGQRCKHVKTQYETSKLNSRLTFGQVK